MQIIHRQFDGLVPRYGDHAPELLPENAATEALDINLHHGILRPVKDNTSAATASGASHESIYKWRYWDHYLVSDTVSHTTASAWAALADGGTFSLNLDNVKVQVNPDFTSDSDMDDVAESIQDAIRDVTGGTEKVSWDGTSSKFTITVNTTIDYLSAPIDSSKTDISTWIEGTSSDTGTSITNTEQSTWLSWAGHVSVVQSPIANDQYDRIYYTGTELDKPKMKIYDAGTVYEQDLAVPIPETAPTANGTAYTEPSDTGVRTYFEIIGMEVRIGLPSDGADGAFIRRKYEITDDEIEYTGDTIIFKDEKIWSPATSGLAIWVYLNVNVLDGSGNVVSNETIYSGKGTNLTYKSNMLEVTSASTSLSPPSGYVLSGSSDYSESQPAATFPSGYWTARGQYTISYNDLSTGDVDTRAPDVLSAMYAYTYVDRFGAESDLSDPSPIYIFDATANRTVSDIEDPSTTGVITKKRLYRSSGGEFHYLADVALGTTTYTDSKDDDELGDSYNLDQNPPDDDMLGLVASPNGFLVGFKGNEVHISEPYKPYAWPVSYRQAVPERIVGLGVSGNDIYVLTRSRPYILSGSTPAEIVQGEMPFFQACSGIRTIAKVGNSVVYASPDGLCALYGGQGRIITNDYFSRDDWQGIDPENLIGSSHDNKYIAFHNTNNAWVFDFDETLDRVVRLSYKADCAFLDTIDDVLYFKAVDATTIYSLATASTYVNTNRWKSRMFEFPAPVQFSCLRVIADSYPSTDKITVELYADGSLVLTSTPSSAVAIKIPKTRPCRKWQVRIYGKAVIHEVALTTSMREMP